MTLLKIVARLGLFLLFWVVSGITFMQFFASDGAKKAFAWLKKFRSRIENAVRVFKEPDNTKVLFGYPSVESYSRERNQNLNAIRRWAQDERKNGHTLSFELKEGRTNLMFLKYDGIRYEAEVFFIEEYGTLYVDKISAKLANGSSIELEGNLPKKPKLDIKKFFENENTQKYCREIAETVNDYGEGMFSIYKCAGCETYADMVAQYTKEEIKAMEEEVSHSYKSFEELAEGLYLCKGYIEQDAITEE